MILWSGRLRVIRVSFVYPFCKDSCKRLTFISQETQDYGIYTSPGKSEEYENKCTKKAREDPRQFDTRAPRTLLPIPPQSTIASRRYATHPKLTMEEQMVRSKQDENLQFFIKLHQRIQSIYRPNSIHDPIFQLLRNLHPNGPVTGTDSMDTERHAEPLPQSVLLEEDTDEHFGMEEAVLYSQACRDYSKSSTAEEHKLNEQRDCIITHLLDLNLNMRDASENTKHNRAIIVTRVLRLLDILRLPGYKDVMADEEFCTVFRNLLIRSGEVCLGPDRKE